MFETIRNKFNALLPPYTDDLHYPRMVKEILLGVSVAVVALPFDIAIECLEEWLRSIVDRPWKDASIDDMSPHLLLFICILAPLMEELLFRKILTPFLKNVLTGIGVENETVAKTSSIVCSSAFFAACHSYGPLAPRFLGGVIYNVLADQGGVHASIASHSTHNMIVAAVKFG